MRYLIALLLACSVAFAGLNFDDSVDEEVTISSSSDHFHPDLSWTAFAHFRFEDCDADERSIIARDTQNSRNFLWRVAEFGATSQCMMEVYQGNVTNCNTTAEIIVDAGVNQFFENVWYFGAVTSDATNIYLYVFGMDGTVIADGTGGYTGTSDQDCQETSTSITCFGHAWPTINDEWDGDGHDCGYISQELSIGQLKEFIHNPRRAFGRYKTTDADDFYLELNTATSPLRDYSGNGNDGTLSGTPTLGANAPTSGR